LAGPKEQLWQFTYQLTNLPTYQLLEMPSFATCSADETTQLGRDLARDIRPGMIVLLRGDLGAGKTTLVKGIAEGFHAASAEDVTSPTFNLIHEYRGPDIILYHIDLYRIDTQRELDTLALDDLIGPKNILLIEWGEKFERFLREKDIEIVIEHAGGDTRRIEVKESTTESRSHGEDSKKTSNKEE
jgi:tRNA threonylcarbamoyladenosine biosynthesis protein TsaE